MWFFSVFSVLLINILLFVCIKRCIHDRNWSKTICHYLPVTSKCCKFMHLVVTSLRAAFVTATLPWICKCVNSGHLLASNSNPLSVNLHPSVRCTLSTLGHAPVLPCPHSCLSTPLIALSPLICSPSNCIVRQSAGVHAKTSNLRQTFAQTLKSMLFKNENILTTISSGNWSNELFLVWCFLPKHKKIGWK